MLFYKNKNKNKKKIYIMFKKKQINVISSKTKISPFSLPDSPPYIKMEILNKITSIDKLKKLETQYDEFLNNNFQILLLLNLLDEILEIRDIIIVRIIKAELRNRREA